MIIWDDPNARYYEHGLDRGVLYPKKTGIPVPWNGLTGMDESGEGGSTTLFYRDGVVFLGDVDATDFSGQVTAISYPNEFAECVGMPQATDGLVVDNQKPKPFDMSYRSLVGSGTKGDMFGYQVHLVYNAMASIGTRSRKTKADNVEILEFTFPLTCTPVRLPGFRPSAHYVIDTRFMSAATVKTVEDILYGAGSAVGRMPTPTELYDLMNFGNAVTFTVHPDGTYTVEGSLANVHEIDDTSFQMNNVNGVDNGDGTYTISSGGTTTVVVE